MNDTATINPQVSFDHAEPEWVNTPTSLEIDSALQYAQSHPTIALIHGGAGLGKTLTVRRYQDQNSHKVNGHRSNVYLISAHPAMKTVTSVLLEISKAIGRGDDACRSDTLARRIEETLRFGDLLIVDEAHDLEIDALNMIRYFHDSVGIGLAYLGNDEVHTRINGRGRKAAMLGPLSSRVGVRCNIPHPRKEDVTAILSAWKVNGSKELEIGLQIGQGRGGLRSLTQVLRQATAIAKSRNSGLDHRAMRDAALTFGNF